MTGNDLDAWHTFCRQLERTGERIVADDFPGSDRDRAEGLRHILRMLTFATQWTTEFGDPDFPAFLRTTDDAVKFGGPSADNRNLRARVDGAGRYRVTGNLGTASDVLFTATAGDMALGQSGVSHEVHGRDLERADDGSFELIVGGTARAGNWLPMAADTRRIQVRQIFSDWSAQEPGWFDIERLDRTTTYPQPLTMAQMNGMLADAGNWVERSATYWNDYQRSIRERVPANTLQAPQAQEGGALALRYGFGWWRLEPGEGLQVEFRPPPGVSWSLQTYNVGWFEALDYRNRQTTLNGAQCAVDPDGAVTIVVSATDPGVANWLDTDGYTEGQLILRVLSCDAPIAAPGCALIAVAGATTLDRSTALIARRRAISRRHRR